MMFLKKALLPLLLAVVMTAVSCTHTENPMIDETTEITGHTTESVTETATELVITTVVAETETAEVTTATITTVPVATTVKPTETTTEYTVLPPTAVPTTISAYYDENTANELLERTNKERAKRFLPPLTLSEGLCEAAKIRSHEISIVFSHTRPDGSSCFTVLGELGYSYLGAGENIAYGQDSPEAVVKAWMNSPGHRANIMNPGFKYLGVGCYESPSGRLYWAQMFAR